jgi:hypothetical protein
MNDYKWVPNLREGKLQEEYVFIELLTTHFCESTKPSCNNIKLTATKMWMANALPETQIPVPIIRFIQSKSGAERFKFKGGQHRTIIANKYANKHSTIIVMVEKKCLKQVVEALNCEIIKTVAKPYQNHQGSLYCLQVKDNKII